MKILAIIAAALVVASVSAGTLRSKYKYKEHAEAMHEATKERVEGWQLAANWIWDVTLYPKQPAMISNSQIRVIQQLVFDPTAVINRQVMAS